VRRLAASALIVLVPFGALVSPFVHAHEDDHHTSHHDGRQIHAHVSAHSASTSGHRAETSVREDEAESAWDVPLFVAVETVTFTVPVLVPARVEVAAPAASVVSSRPLVAHAHDPPGKSPFGPRAPPAYLS
jgi:hypothetical protein